jgi:hypothetical protein
MLLEVAYKEGQTQGRLPDDIWQRNRTPNYHGVNPDFHRRKIDLQLTLNLSNSTHIRVERADEEDAVRAEREVVWED